MSDHYDDAKLIKLTQALLRCESITPNSAGCFNIITTFCQQLGFVCQRLDQKDTQNLYICWPDTQKPALLFCGHVDVVPPGDLKAWQYPPFTATCANDNLYGRGAVDMKSSIAAFLIAMARSSQHQHVAMLLTSDEEGPATHGTQYALQQLHAQGVQFSAALVGEPTSKNHVGDTLKIGRRGSLSAHIILHGQQGHAAYPQHAVNPIDGVANLISALRQQPWDQACSWFPATHCSLIELHAGVGASNVTPGTCALQINFRYSPKLCPERIASQLQQLISPIWADFQVNWRHSAKPFLKKPGAFAHGCQNILLQHTQQKCDFSTDGGTSDARFVQQYVQHLVEFGPLHASAHHCNEHIPIADLCLLAKCYTDIIQQATVL